jgi:cellulose synthase/poly-beta-1,6-N-acetylglucosamine synthase-like glycosyltransferase
VSTADLLLMAASLVLTVLAGYTISLMLYAWEDEGRHQYSRAPATFEPAQLRFTILLPARHEEAVIQDTIQRVVDLEYPRHLVQILVVVEAGDAGTIGQIRAWLDRSDNRDQGQLRLLTFDDPPINKPHGLNVGLAQATGDVVTIFDAEDEPHPRILHVVNTVMQREAVPVVQCGVQLMNYRDHWYSALNVLEYLFWFKSRMHYHAAAGMVPLGGNTVFVRHDVLDGLGGWDQTCLTEDADLGIRLSASRLPIRVVYDVEYVTREETPPTVDQFIRQRTRWSQGFLQVLKKGEWLRLPTVSQRALALYTLAFPLLQALMMLYLPVSLLTTFAKVPELVAMVSLLPLYMLLAQLAISLVGLFEFTSAYGLRPGLWTPVRMILTYLPYQWLLAFAALRAVWREARGVTTWEKTAHTGAHRRARPAVLIAGDDGRRG